MTSTPSKMTHENDFINTRCIVRHQHTMHRSSSLFTTVCIVSPVRRDLSGNRAIRWSLFERDVLEPTVPKGEVFWETRWVAMYVRSATQSRFGPSTSRSLERSGKTGSSWLLSVVATKCGATNKMRLGRLRIPMHLTAILIQPPQPTKTPVNTGVYGGFIYLRPI